MTCPKAVAPFAEMMELVFVLEALAKEDKDGEEEHLDRTGRGFFLLPSMQPKEENW